MSLIDSTIKMSGSAMTIIRSGGNVSSFFQKDAMTKKGVVPLRSYERFYFMPTDSIVVEGDLILSGSDYYLVMSLSKKELHGKFQCYQGTLFKCNSIATVRQFNGVSKAYADFKTNVQCLIVKAQSGPGMGPTDDDRSVVSSAKGRGKVFVVYAQADSGILKSSLLVDQNSRQFRVSDDSNPFIVGGVVESEMLWANA